MMLALYAPSAVVAVWALLIAVAGRSDALAVAALAALAVALAAQARETIRRRRRACR